MSTWLLVALVSNAALAVLCGVFLAGTMRRSNLIVAGIITGLGVVVLLLLLMSSTVTLPSLFPFNPIRVAKRVWETSDFASVISGILIGVPAQLFLGFATVMHVLRGSPRWQAPASALFVGLPLVLLFAVTMLVSPSVAVPTVDKTASLTVPAGFEIHPYLPQGLYRPTSIAFDSKDRLYIATRDGIVNMVDDADGDGVGDEIRDFAYKDGMALGVAVSADGETVYIAGGGQVVKVEDIGPDGTPGSSTVIIDGLPSFVYDAHSNNGLEMGPDGRLYLTLGGTTDHGPEDHSLAGKILVANPDGSGLRAYAHGLRNPYDITFTSDGLLIATDNGPDFQDSRLNWSPPDELNLVREGQNYGYPDVFGFPPDWSDSTGPVAVFPSHSVPTGTVAYPGGQFPSIYRNRVFVTLFGAFVNPRFEEFVDPEVVAVTLEEPTPGTIRGVIEDFATGFTAPIDVAVDSKGRLYVADYGAHQVFRISWMGAGQ